MTVHNSNEGIEYIDRCCVPGSSPFVKNLLGHLHLRGCYGAAHLSQVSEGGGGTQIRGSLRTLGHE